jgi:hypothetical protein
MLENISENVKSQYELLNILDSKASALLTFNALGLASISIWLGYVPLNYLHLALDLIFIVLLVSCGSLLRIIWLRWAAIQEKVEVLNRIRQDRSRHYRLAWKLSIGSVICLVLISTVHTLGTAMVSTDTCGPLCRDFYSKGIRQSRLWIMRLHDCCDGSGPIAAKRIRMHPLWMTIVCRSQLRRLGKICAGWNSDGLCTSHGWSHNRMRKNPTRAAR